MSKKVKKILALLLCAVSLAGILAACQKNEPPAPSSGGKSDEEKPGEPNPSDGEGETPPKGGDTEHEDTGWKAGFTDEQLAAFYNAPIKVGYTEDFKYTTKGYTVGSGDNAEEVNYFQDLVREKFPNAEFFKIENQYDITAIAAADCDVVVGLNTYALQALKNAGALKEFVPEWAGEVAANLNDDDNQYFAISKDMVLSMYRVTGVVDDSADLEKQKDKETFGGIEITGVSAVTDLWKEGSQYIGKYELDRYMNDWNDLANKTLLVGLLANYLDASATDTDCVTQEGWDQLAAMIAGRSNEWLNAETQKNICGTGDYINNIAATQITFDYASDGMDKAAWYWAAGKCARLDVIRYAYVPTFIYGAAIMNTTGNVEASQLFMDFIGAADTVRTMALHVRTLIPANTTVFNETNVKELDENGSGSEYKDYTAALDADGNKIVRIIPSRQYMLTVMDIPAQDIDWDLVCEHLDAWIARANALNPVRTFVPEAE